MCAEALIGNLCRSVTNSPEGRREFEIRVAPSQERSRMEIRMKIIIVMMYVGLLSGIVLCSSGCGKEPNDEKNRAVTEVLADAPETSMPEEAQLPSENSLQQETESETDDVSRQEYVFPVGEIILRTDMDVEEAVGKLGECKSVFEAPSCAGEGTSYIYTYDSFEIETYPTDEGKNLIGYIVLRDDTVATAEGIDLSMTRSDVIQAYGSEYEEAQNSITYEKNGTKLNFIFDGDELSSIEYVSAVIG